MPPANEVMHFSPWTSLCMAASNSLMSERRLEEENKITTTTTRSSQEEEQQQTVSESQASAPTNEKDGDNATQSRAPKKVSRLLCLETISSDTKVSPKKQQQQDNNAANKPKKKKSVVVKSQKSNVRFLRGIPPHGKRDMQWNLMFRRLQEFKHHNGHCNVPQGYVPDPELATWVKNQRQAYRYMLEKKTTKRISPDRVTRLNHIGFEWRKYVRSEEYSIRRATAVPAAVERIGQRKGPSA